jgi:hypothetical protein
MTKTEHKANAFDELADAIVAGIPFDEVKRIIIFKLRQQETEEFDPEPVNVMEISKLLDDDGCDTPSIGELLDQDQLDVITEAPMRVSGSSGDEHAIG